MMIYAEYARLRDRARRMTWGAIPGMIVPWVGFAVGQMLPHSDTPPLVALAALSLLSVIPLTFWLLALYQFRQARRAYRESCAAERAAEPTAARSASGDQQAPPYRSFEGPESDLHERALPGLRAKADPGSRLEALLDEVERDRFWSRKRKQKGP